MKVLVGVLLTALLLCEITSNSCLDGDSVECSSSVCANYIYTNSSCARSTSRNCTTYQNYVQSNSMCYSCGYLGEANCTNFCPDYVYMSSSSSSQKCKSCESLYGTNCIRCTPSACVACRYSSNTMLASDGQSCFKENCTIDNCVDCFGSKCAKCKNGFQINGSSLCEVASCSITNCMTCVGTVCQRCDDGYQASASGDACNPNC